MQTRITSLLTTTRYASPKFGYTPEPSPKDQPTSSITKELEEGRKRDSEFRQGYIFGILTAGCIGSVLLTLTTLRGIQENLQELNRSTKSVQKGLEEASQSVKKNRESLEEILESLRPDAPG